MRIVHLSTGHVGGAGLAARRLSLGLRSLGIDSYFVALNSPSFVPGEKEFAIDRNPFQEFNSGISTFVSQRLSKKSLVTPISLNIIKRDLLQKFEDNQKTIFHVHNWFNIFSQSELAVFSREFNFVLTLHDQRFFTGACHYSLGCENFRHVCAKCPQLPKLLNHLSSRIHTIDIDFSNISFITPSEWLLDLAKTSKLLGNSSIRMIPNSFYGYESQVMDFRRSRSTINIGFAAMDPESWIKGGDIISSLKFKHAHGEKFKFFALSDFQNYKDFWSQIDVLLVPSRADNSPNVIHEAKLWGIPVVSSDSGGIPEILSDNFDACIPLAEMMPSRIEDEILRVFLYSYDFGQRLDVAKAHQEFLDTSVPLHVDFYNSISLK